MFVLGSHFLDIAFWISIWGSGFRILFFESCFVFEYVVLDVGFWILIFRFNVGFVVLVIVLFLDVFLDLEFWISIFGSLLWIFVISFFLGCVLFWVFIFGFLFWVLLLDRVVVKSICFIGFVFWILGFVYYFWILFS